MESRHVLERFINMAIEMSRGQLMFWRKKEKMDLQHGATGTWHERCACCKPFHPGSCDLLSLLMLRLADLEAWRNETIIKSAGSCTIH